MSTATQEKAARRPAVRVSAKSRASEPPEAPKRKDTGRRLINLLMKTVRDRGLPDRTPADVLGITQIYWNSINNGHREIRSLPKEKLSLAAEFLGISVIDVYNLADYFGPEDFLVSTNLDDRLYQALETMRVDPTWMSLAPTQKEWKDLPMKVKVALVSLYEREFGRQILAKASIEDPTLVLPGSKK